MFDKSYFLVFVPGYMGSVLRDENADQTLWIDFSTIVSDLDHWLARMRFPESGISNLRATKVMDKIVFVNPLAHDEGYMKLWDMFEKFGMKAIPALHAENDLDVYGFPYDWRQDNIQSAKELKAKIDYLKTQVHPNREVWIMAHSNGGLVARWYIEQLSGKDVVNKLILLGSPWDGTPKVVQVGITGADFFIGSLQMSIPKIRQMSRELFRTFPSLYQLIPLHNAFLKDSTGNAVDPFDGSLWLDNAKQSQYLAAGKQFSETLGDANSVDTICLYGYDFSTITGGVVDTGPTGRWQTIKWLPTFEGDGTIPTISAKHRNRDVERGVAVSHTRFHLEEPSKLRLGQILGKEEISKVSTTVGRFRIVFKPNRRVYGAGQPIRLEVKVTDRETEKAIKQIKAAVMMEWAEEFPNEQVVEPTMKPIPIQMQLKRSKLIGMLNAPPNHGYYRLTANVTIPVSIDVGLDEEIQVQLSELIAVRR